MLSLTHSAMSSMRYVLPDNRRTCAERLKPLCLSCRNDRTEGDDGVILECEARVFWGLSSPLIVLLMLLGSWWSVTVSYSRHFSSTITV